MSNRLSSEDFGIKIYNRFPPKYCEDDALNDYSLKRYLQTASDGGFKYIIDEQNGILDLVDPESCDIEVLYILYEQYGLKLFPGIPEEFLRAFLPNLSSVYSKKGSLDVIDLIASSLSGIKTETAVTYDSDGFPHIAVRLDMDIHVSNYFPDTKMFERLLTNFVPFYCDVGLLYSYAYLERKDLKLNEVDSTDHVTDIKEDKISLLKNSDSCISNRISLSHKEDEGNIRGNVKNSFINSKGLLSDSFYTNGFSCWDTVTKDGTSKIIYT